MLERDVIAKVLRWARRHPEVVPIRIAMQAGVSAGWPDYCFVLPHGVSVWIEFKAPGKKPTPLQELRLTTLRERGHYAAVIDNPDAAIALLEKYL